MRLGLAFLMLAALVGGALASGDVPARASRTVAIDWGLAQTLIALGAPPLGVAETAGYREWVAEPPLPPDTAEIGLRSGPSLEFVAALRPDVILSTPQFAAIEPTIGRVAPVLSLATYTEDARPYRNAVAVTRRIGQLLGRERQAERLVAETEARIDRLATSLGQQPRRKALVLAFHDDRHVWVFGKGSLYDDVLRKAGIENAWDGAPNLWGIANASVEELARLDGDMAVFIVEPVPLSLRDKLENPDGDSLVGRIRLFAKDRIRILPPVWGFGGLPSAGRFADALRDTGRFLLRSADAR